MAKELCYLYCREANSGDTVKSGAKITDYNGDHAIFVGVEVDEQGARVRVRCYEPRREAASYRRSAKNGLYPLDLFALEVK